MIEVQKETAVQRQSKSETPRASSGDFAWVRPQETMNTSAHHPSIAAERGPMKLIRWGDIWSSLRAVKIRGHGEMIEVFYETLFKEAVFDDDGPWSLEQTRRNECRPDD